MEQIKAIRRNIDHLMQESKKVSTNREMALAYTHMQRGTMWLGLVLAAIGTANPYPDSTNIENKKIEDRADQAKDEPTVFPGIGGDGDRTIQVKWLRNALDGVASQIRDLETPAIQLGYRELQVAYDAIRESKMWLGWELNNIHTADKQQ